MLARSLHRAAAGVWRLWRGLHALLACPSRLELGAVQLLLELGAVHRPRSVASFAALAQEPLVLFRLPVSLLRVPLAFSLVQFMYMSLSVASESAARESSSRIQAKERQSLTARVSPEGGAGAEGEGMRGGDLCEEYSTLQAVIAVRVLLEVWLEVNHLAAASAACPPPSGGGGGSAPTSESGSDDVVLSSMDAVGSGICDMISTLVADRPPLLAAVLYCGIPQWTSFRLLASASPGVMTGIAQLTYESLALSLSSEHASPLSASSAALEGWLWHVVFLLKVQRMQPQRHSAPSNAANRWICKLAESLCSFFTKSMHYSWWNVLPLVGHSNSNTTNDSVSLGSTCLDLLTMLSVRFPAQALQTMKCLLGASLPATHLFAAPGCWHSRLAALLDDTRRAYHPPPLRATAAAQSSLLSQKRARTTTEL